MEAVGVALAIPAVIELCLKYGNHFYKRYQTFHNAEDEMRTRILRVEGHWLQIKAQISHLQRIWYELPGRLQVHLNHVLSRLEQLLWKANSMIDGLFSTNGAPKSDLTATASIRAVMSKEGKLRRGIFAFGRKDALDNLIDEIISWHQDMLGPSWFQLLLVPGIFEAELGPAAEATEAPVQELEKVHRNVKAAEDITQLDLRGTTLPLGAVSTQQGKLFASTAVTTTLVRDGTPVLIDPIPLSSEVDADGTTDNFAKLARKMSTIDHATMGLLQCDGLLTEPLALIFRMPSDFQSPRSLREVLLETDSFTHMQVRLTIAVQLAKAVMSIHSLNIVHKNIRPETILVFESKSDQSQAAFILGFEAFRPVDAETRRRGDAVWQKDIYRHPSRQGLHPQTDYMMQHDIYSLGVCLLELGLCRSFVLNPGGKSLPHAQAQIDSPYLSRKEPWIKARMLKERFQHLALSELPGRMGGKYSDAVLSCLSCLDKGNIEFGDEDDLYDKNEILVSIRFMEKVLLQLREISV